MKLSNKFLYGWLIAICLMGCTSTAPSPANPFPAVPTATLPAPPTASVAESNTPPPFALLYASDESGRGELYTLNNGIRSAIPLPAEVESAWQPALSADGSQILFTGRRNGQSDIGLSPLAGGTVTWLTDSLADDHSPAWSPDGATMAWVSEQDGRGHIWLKAINGEGEATRIPSLVGDQPTRNPAFLPNGSLIYAAIDQFGSEFIYEYPVATETPTMRMTWPYKGTQPAANSKGEVAFVGWVENPPWRGIYTLSDVLTPTLLWETTDWIGDPAWSDNEQWIVFTRAPRDGTGHDLWALPAAGGEPRRLTESWAWETDAVALTGSAVEADTLTALPPTADVTATPAAALPPMDFVAGFNVAGLENAYLSRDVGFGWGKGFAFWERIEQEPGVYDWRDVDNTVQRYEQAGLQIFLRVDRTPTWARPADTIGSHPPTDMEAYARFLEALAARYKGRVAVYELWNEPNLSYEWGNKFPDPALYVEMLKVASPALARGDPDAQLVVGALAVSSTTHESMDDLEWMEQFYQALGTHDGTLYDAFSTHPYGFAQPPNFPPEQGLGLRRLEAHHAIMQKYGDPVPLWLTELGYPRTAPAWDLGSYHLWMVSDELQAQYLVETMDYLQATYPYVQAAFFFNLDFSTVDWYVAGEQMRAFAVLDSARRPLPAFTRLRQRQLQLLP